ncbi:MAG: hypothetical protein QNJ88_08225 [Acidimicrobiia bacterium]|nr:hypothetical protein [Acidimicrobiia bacterium]
MTPTEMRQQAARKRARAAALDSAAARLRVIADEIRPLLSDLASRSREVWIGPAASDFERRATEADAEVKVQAALLVSTAGDFAIDARRLRSEAASLDTQAATAEAAAALGCDASPMPASIE